MDGTTVTTERCDPWTFDGPGDLYCYPRDGRGRRLAVPDLGVSVVFDPATGTLDSGGFDCWYRSGSDPVVGD